MVVPRTSSLSKGNTGPYTNWCWLFSGSFVLSPGKKTENKNNWRRLVTSNILISMVLMWFVSLISIFCSSQSNHKCFKRWWLALPETINKPLINISFNLSMPEGPSYPVLTIIKELFRQFESLRGLLRNCIIYIIFLCTFSNIPIISPLQLIVW